MSDTKNTPYLKDFKEKLDASQAGNRPLHVCIESSHPSTLGRPSDSLLSFLLSKKLYDADIGKQTQVKYHFIPDRLNLPKLNGHVLAFGGPRSNVVSRIAMEYEAGLSRSSKDHQRFPGITFPLDYQHVHRDDYDGRVLAEMTSLDEMAKELIYRYYEKLNNASRKGGVDLDWKLNLFSVNRHLQYRDPQSRTVQPLPSLSIEDLETDKVRDWVIYDQCIETIMPNVFSENWQTDKLIIYHGLRDLGTFSSALMLEKRVYQDALINRINDLVDFDQQLKDKELTDSEERQFSGAQQVGWRIIRPIENLIGKPLMASTNALFKEKSFDVISAETGNVIWAYPHEGKSQKNSSRKHERSRFVKNDVTVRHRDVQALNRDIYKQHYAIDPLNKQHSDFRRGYKNSVKMEQINHEQILDAMSLSRDEHFRRHDIYILGCFEGKKTIYTQQTRALTLIHALFKAGKIQKGTKIGIIGGGVSGVSAAIAAASTGARVVLCEKGNGLFPIQRDCDHRWLHPYAYDWPSEHVRDDSTNLPFASMNWTAGPANKVLAKLENQFSKFRVIHNQGGDNKELTVYPNFECKMVLYDRKNGKHIICEKAFKRDAKSGNDRKLILTSEDFEPPKPPSQNDLASGGTHVESQLQEWQKWTDDWKLAASAIVRQIQNGDEADIQYVPGSRTGLVKKRIKSNDEDRFSRNEIVDCDILIFATGFGQENPTMFAKKTNLPRGQLLNGGYWQSKEDNLPTEPPNAGERSSNLADRVKRALQQEKKDISIKIDDAEISEAHKEISEGKTSSIYVVSGSGDGALIDILRLCIKQFSDPRWQEDLINRLSDSILPQKKGPLWSNRRDVIVFAHALRDLFKSDEFNLTEGEKDRIDQINRTMEGFDISNFMDQMNIQLNDVHVYNIARDVQPFWTESSVANRLLVWCLHRSGRVRFIRGSLESMVSKDGKSLDISPLHDEKDASIRRKLTGKSRTIRPEGIIIRHGVGDQPSSFLKTQGLFVDFDKSAIEISRDARRLVALLKLSDRLHAETEKFFRHTVNNL